MEEIKIQEYKRRLLESKKETEDFINELGTPIDLGNFPGNEDEIDESTMSFEQGAKENAMRQKLSAIESALARIEKNEYGICETCTGIIEEDVLDIIPESRACRSCKASAHKE